MSDVHSVGGYGIQTYLASVARDILVVRLWPGHAAYGDVAQHGFLGLSTLGYFTFARLWVLPAAVFWTGMDTIRKFIDFCGSAVSVVMFLLCGYLLMKADGKISLNLSTKELSGGRGHLDDVRGDRAGRLLLLQADAQLR